MPETIQELIDTIDESIEAHGTPDGEDVPRAVATDQSLPGTTRPRFHRDAPTVEDELRIFSADAATLAPPDNVYSPGQVVAPSARYAARLNLAAAGIPPKYRKPLRQLTGNETITLPATPSRQEQKAWRDTLFPRPNHRTSLPVRILEIMIEAINLARPQRFWERHTPGIVAQAVDEQGYELAEVDWDKDRHAVKELNWEQIYDPNILGYIDYLRYCMVRRREPQDPRLMDMHPVISVLIDMRHCIQDLGPEMSPDLQRRILSTLDYLRERYCPLLQWRE